MCQTARTEYNKATKMLLERIEEGKEKDARLQKLALANERLQGLCRALRSQAADSGAMSGDTAAPDRCNGAASHSHEPVDVQGAPGAKADGGAAEGAEGLIASE